MTAANKISMCSESVRTRRRGCEVVHCARPVDNTARLDLDTVAVKPSVPPRRPGQQNDAALHEAVRAHWREVVRRLRPVDNTARLDPDVDNTARTDLGVDDTARTDLGVDALRGPISVLTALRGPISVLMTLRGPISVLMTLRGPISVLMTLRGPISVLTTLRGPISVLTTLRGPISDVDNTARLDPETVPVKPSAPPRRPRQQNDAAPHEAVRARGPGGDVVRRARPVDSAARLRRGPVKPSAPPRRPRQQNDAALHEAVRARGPGGDVVRRARPVDSAARLRRRAVKPSVPPRRPRQQNDAALHEAVTVGEANLWGLRVKRTAMAFGAVLLFVALVVFSGRPFGGDDQPAPQPSVPSASGDGSSAATEQQQPAPIAGCASRRLIRRRTATGPRRASVFRRH